MARVRSSIVGFIRSSSSSRSLRRRQAHGANGSLSNCARPCSLHSFFFRRWPSFIARACSWFIIRVRASAPCGVDAIAVAADRDSPDSEPSSGGSYLPIATSTEVGRRWNRSSACGLVWSYLRGVPDPQFDAQLCQQPLEPAGVSGGFHSHSHASRSRLQIPIELLC